jgi:hypothetical protein
VIEIRSAPRLFDNRLSREWVGYTILRRVVIGAAIVHFSLAAVSGYRAVTQVYRASFAADGPSLHVGSRLAANIVTAGRTHVDVTVELIQNGRRATLGTMVVPDNDSFFYDFRPKRARLDIRVSREMLEGFKPGPASLHVTAVGRQQWLYLPPPKTDRLAVTIQ